MPLHLTKVAFGASSLEDVRGWFAGQEGEARLTTRYAPKRLAELEGGSLYWILKHRLVARSPILRFEAAEDGRTHIVVSTGLVEVGPLPRRAHQGWRYLDDKDVPTDLAGSGEDEDVLPLELASELARLGLV